MEARKPAEVEAVAAALEPCVTITDTGIALDAPAHVTANLDPEIVAALQDAVKLTNDPGTAGSGMAPAGIWSWIVKFVQKHWKTIVNAAKKAKVWTWRKAPRCLQGAAEAVLRWSRGSVEVIVAAPEQAVAETIVGCIKRIR